MDDREIQSKCGEEAQSLPEASQESKWNVRLQNLEWVGIESHNSCPQVEPPGFSDHLTDKVAMPKVDTVEDSNGDRRSAIEMGILCSSDHLHLDTNTLVGRHISECASYEASAKKRPVPSYTRTSPPPSGFASTPCP